MVSVAAAQGTIAPELSLHFKVTNRPYRDGDEALDAIAADQINYRRSATWAEKRGEYTHNIGSCQVVQ